MNILCGCSQSIDGTSPEEYLKGMSREEDKELKRHTSPRGGHPISQCVGQSEPCLEDYIPFKDGALCSTSSTEPPVEVQSDVNYQ